MLVAFTMLRGPGPLLLCRAGARALSSVPGSSGAGDDMKERAKQAVADAAGTDASHPSLMEKAREAMGKVTEKVGEMFEDTGAVGSQFTEKGAVGGTVQEKAGGESSPLDKEGSVGKQFTTEGAVGGNVQRAAERVDEAGERMQHKAQHQQGQEAAKEHTPGMRRDKV